LICHEKVKRQRRRVISDCVSPHLPVFVAKPKSWMGQAKIHLTRRIVPGFPPLALCRLTCGTKGECRVTIMAGHSLPKRDFALKLTGRFAASQHKS
jgi:hypothetical protein